MGTSFHIIIFYVYLLYYIDRPILNFCCTDGLFYFLYLSIRFNSNISATIPDNDRVERGFSLTMCLSKKIFEMAKK